MSEMSSATKTTLALLKAVLVCVVLHSLQLWAFRACSNFIGVKCPFFPSYWYTLARLKEMRDENLQTILGLSFVGWAQNCLSFFLSSSLQHAAGSRAKTTLRLRNWFLPYWRRSKKTTKEEGLLLLVSSKLHFTLSTKDTHWSDS